MLNQRSWGPLHRGFSEGPLGRVWPSLPHLISNPLGVCWQLHRGFPRSPSVGCGLPYHISSLSGSLLATALGVSEVPSVGCGFPYHIWSLAVWESAGNCSGTPNSTELNNNSTPTRSPTGSLKSNVLPSSSGNNCHAVQRLLSSGAWL